VTVSVIDLVRTGLREHVIATPKEEAELRTFLAERFGVVIPDQQVCPHHTSPWRVFADAFFAKHRVMVLKGSRAFSGKSYLLAALGVLESVALGVNVSILGGSGTQSRRVMAYMAQFWNFPAAPRELLRNEPGSIQTKFRGGNVIEALMASQRSVRGGHPVRLRLDEADEMPWPVFEAAAGLTLSAAGVQAQTLIASTHHNPDGTFSGIVERAREQGWPLLEYCYKETLEPHGWLPATEIAAKRAEMSDAAWRTEVELQEPSPEGRAIDTPAVVGMFNPQLGEFEGRAGEYVEIEGPSGDGRRFATGVDWGKSLHWTVIVTIRTDCRPWKIVAFERIGRQAWPKMTARLVARLKRFGGVAWHDATGLGQVVEDLLKDQGVKVDGRKVKGVTMIGRDRAELFAGYVKDIETKEIVAPMIRYMRQEHLFLRNEDLTTKHPPDSFIAGALACGAARKGMGVSADAVPVGVGDGRSYWEGPQ
tara:strand:- start:36966 stop:38399 length:1434 start_codon:yes stop_codon:yes gene_type:complete